MIKEKARSANRASERSIYANDTITDFKFQPKLQIEFSESGSVFKIIASNDQEESFLLEKAEFIRNALMGAGDDY